MYLSRYEQIKFLFVSSRQSKNISETTLTNKNQTQIYVRMYHGVPDLYTGLGLRSSLLSVSNVRNLLKWFILSLNTT